jgi:N-acetyl-beta-hexosaminidase
VCRHFFDIAEIKKMMKTAAYFGFNHFHFHISDDQGYRLCSEVYPRLNEIASFRYGDHFGRYRSDERCGGFYQKEEIKNLVEYAASLGIEIVPEIDIPGHMSAIIADYPHGFIRMKKFYDLDMKPPEFADAIRGKGTGKIIGNECLIWTEYIRDNEKLESLAWPRFAAAGVVGYLGDEKPEYRIFKNTLAQEFDVFIQNDIRATKVREADPGIFRTLRQLVAFKKQLDPDLIANYKKTMNEI